MNDKERTKEYWLKKLVNKECTVQDAAGSLGLSTRQVKRLKKGYIEKGVESVIHGNLNRKPKHAISEELKKEIINLKISDRYKEANIAHFYDLIKEYEMIDVKIKYETVFKILKDAGIKSPKKHRKKQKQHPRRKRLETFGKMLQIDATPYDWFGDGRRYNLHGAIDDATSKITSLYMSENECLEGYFRLMERTFKEHGRPESLYSDRHLILHPLREMTVIDQLEGRTIYESHFSRAMHKLNIRMIRAYSPEAKGRIERLWGTLQSRLPIEFKINNVKTIEEANKFLTKYLAKFNRRFGINDEIITNVFRPLPEGIKIKYILCREEKRMLNVGCTISLSNRIFKVKTDKIPYNSKVSVLISKNTGIVVEYKGEYYQTELFEDRKTEGQYGTKSEVIDKMVMESLKEAANF